MCLRRWLLAALPKAWSAVSGQRLAVDASLIEADANRQNSTPKEEWEPDKIDPEDAPRAVREYLATLDEAAFGAATPVQPKFTSHSDPASQWTAARKGPAFFAYSANYMIDTDHAVILDVEARSDEWGDWLGAQGVKGDVSSHLIVFPTQALALDGAITGLGVALTDRRLAQDDIDAGRLVQVSDYVHQSGRGFYFVHPRKSVEDKRQKRFLTWLQAELQKQMAPPDRTK